MSKLDAIMDGCVALGKRVDALAARRADADEAVYTVLVNGRDYKNFLTLAEAKRIKAVEVRRANKNAGSYGAVSVSIIKELGGGRHENVA